MPCGPNDQSHMSKCTKSLSGVKIGKKKARGNLDDKMLNGIICIQNGKLGGTNKNPLFKILFSLGIRKLTKYSHFKKRWLILIFGATFSTLV
jgi:hypothetical protein